MKIAIMQPYFYPYLGYWQLMHAVDTYIVYDDGYYRPRGWINRNRIMVGEKPHYITIPVCGSEKMRINEIIIAEEGEYNKKKIIRSIETSYGKANYFKDCFAQIKSSVLSSEYNLSQYLIENIECIRKLLGIKTPFIKSSDIPKDQNTPAQEKIFQICDYLGAKHYINAFGGRELYSKEEFQKRGLHLSFLKMDDDMVEQVSGNRSVNLSIIDGLMRNSVDLLRSMLDMYDLV